MKRFVKYIIILPVFLILIMNSAFAQNEVDALRYSQNFQMGTARSVGLGGAIGAVGGDFSSLSVNPAGIGLYRGSEMTFTPYLSWNETSASFLGNTYSDENYKLGISNFGLVFNYPRNNQSGWISTSFGVGYNRMNTFNREVFMGGIQNNSSFLDNLVYNAGTLSSDDLDPLYEALAWDTYMIDWDEDAGEYFNDFADGGYGQIQERSISSRGSIGEYLLSFGANYNHRLYIGATIGINHARFEQTVVHYEEDAANTISFTDRFSFEEYLLTSGVGYNLKLGMIARPADFVRIGAAFHLPTFYYMRDEFENSMEAYIDAGEGFDNPQFATSGLSEYRYELKTPAKAVGSIALTFAKKAMLTMDYEYMNYQNANLNASDYNFTVENQDIETIYTDVHNFRFGGEYRLGPAYIRGGYGFYASPFSSQPPNVDNTYQIISGGLGIRNKSFFIDAGYSYKTNESIYYPYVPGITDGAVLNTNANSVLLTMGFRF